MCRNVISSDRKSDAITCSPECTRKRKDYLRSKLDQRECRYCNKPSTPEDRVLFGMWRKAHKRGMADEQFTAQVLATTRLVRENERLKRRLGELQAGTVPNGSKADGRDGADPETA